MEAAGRPNPSARKGYVLFVVRPSGRSTFTHRQRGSDALNGALKTISAVRDESG